MSRDEIPQFAIELAAPMIAFWGGHIVEARDGRNLLYQSEDSYERIRYKSKHPSRFKPPRGEGIR